jgi:uncharacterized FlgJ-related protein
MNSSENSENAFLQNPSGTLIPNIAEQPIGKRDLNNSIIYWVIGSVFTIILAAVIIILVTRSTDYEHGVMFLHSNDTKSALSEFQKIAPDDRMYEMALSKINYINGLIEYNNNNLEASKTYLTKVDESDEYYPDAKLMLDRIAISFKLPDLNTIREKVNKVKDAEVKADK